MQRILVSRPQTYPGIVALSSLLCASVAHGADTYAGGVLSMPSLAIGSATYSNVVVTVGSILSGPTGSSANGTVDSYDPGTNQLTVQSVTAGGTTYHNVVVTVAGLVSIGSVSGADTYDGNALSIAFVQLGNKVYSNVLVTESLGDVIRVAGGMPTEGPDIYNLATNELSIPAVQVGNRVFTNVLVTAGRVLAAAGFEYTNQETVLHDFTGTGSGASGSTDGATPMGLVQGTDGNFYGTTSSGGANSLGTVFKLSTTGAESVLYSFAGYPSDSAVPDAGLVQYSNGTFYGTTNVGGPGNVGTVFTISATGVESMIYAFNGAPGDGANPRARLIEGNDGNLYGTTRIGGTASGSAPHGNGTVFEITPEGVETALYPFAGTGGDGTNPVASLIQGSGGYLYGTTSTGGANGFGSVFSVTIEGAETVLYSFSGPNGDGAYPLGALIQGNDGNFYGTTSNGGTIVPGDPNGNGTVFKITPGGVETVLYSFAGSNGDPSQPDPTGDGQEPNSALVQGRDGNFYGITGAGGVYGVGSVFKITPLGVETVIYSFTDANGDGGGPNSLIMGSDGNLYGTTSSGGVGGNGTVFRIVL